jgi:hypothetical protein
MTTPVFERTMTVDALHRAATVIGADRRYTDRYVNRHLGNALATEVASSEQPRDLRSKL